MKNGQKLKRYCAGCSRLKEQVKDGMVQNSQGWTCRDCIDAIKMWDKLLAKRGGHEWQGKKRFSE